MVMAREQGAMGFNDQCVAMVSISFGKGAINGNRLATALEGRFAFLHFHRYVAVDDEADRGVDIEFS